MSTYLLEPMTRERLRRLKGLEGRLVSLTLRDGSRLDDCQLVSIGRLGARSLWLVNSGVDTFVPATDVVDLWEKVA